MPVQLRAHHERNVAATSVPLWQFSGMMLIVLAIGFGMFSNHLDKERQARFLEQPMEGDVYHYESKPGSFTSFKVASVKNDTLTVRFNDYEVNMLSGIQAIDKEENYSDTTYFMTRKELIELFAAGSIPDINRERDVLNAKVDP